MDKVIKVSDSIVRVEKVIPQQVIEERTEVVEYNLPQIRDEYAGLKSQEEEITRSLEEVQGRLKFCAELLATLGEEIIA